MFFRLKAEATRLLAGLTVTAEPPVRVARRAQTIGTSVAVFVLAFLYRLPDATALINDHFMHLVFGRQLLWGRLPVRDAVSLGMPLQTGLSAAAEWLVGYRLLSEGLVISTAFAAAAVLTFVLIRRATGSLVIAVAGALLEVAIAPRTYSYPKLVVYAAGILLLWRYVDRPSNRRAVELGLATALAFYLRHDHGLYLGLSRGGGDGDATRPLAARGRATDRCPRGHMCAVRHAVLRVRGNLRQRAGLRDGSASVLGAGAFEQPVRLAVVAAAVTRESIVRWTSRRGEGGPRSTSDGTRPRRTPLAARRPLATMFRFRKRVR